MRSEQTLAKPVLQRRKDLPLYHLRCFKAVLKCLPLSVRVFLGRSLALHSALSFWYLGFDKLNYLYSVTGRNLRLPGRVCFVFNNNLFMAICTSYYVLPSVILTLINIKIISFFSTKYYKRRSMYGVPKYCTMHAPATRVQIPDDWTWIDAHNI